MSKNWGPKLNDKLLKRTIILNANIISEAEMAVHWKGKGMGYEGHSCFW